MAVSTETALQVTWPNEADEFLPRSVADEMEMSEREGALAREVMALREMIEREDRRQELVDEQLGFALETLKELVKLRNESSTMRVAVIRERLDEIVSECKADF